MREITLRRRLNSSYNGLAQETADREATKGFS